MLVTHFTQVLHTNSITRWVLLAPPFNVAVWRVSIAVFETRWEQSMTPVVLHFTPTVYNCTWWLIPLSKWVITPVINGISRVNPLITWVYNPLTKWDEPPSTVYNCTVYSNFRSADLGCSWRVYIIIYKSDGHFLISSPQCQHGTRLTNPTFPNISPDEPSIWGLDSSTWAHELVRVRWKDVERVNPGILRWWLHMQRNAYINHIWYIYIYVRIYKYDNIYM